MKKKLQKEFQITAQGSLGILALGHIGIEQWRKVVDAEKDRLEKQKDNEAKSNETTK